jgi:hypothetical protein
MPHITHSKREKRSRKRRWIILIHLEKFTLSSDEYYALVTKRELDCGRFIFLDEGKIRFDHVTLSPHGEIIGEVSQQIAVQDRPHRLFFSGTGNSMSILGFPLNVTDVNLVPGCDKQPDGHWAINVARLLNPPPPGTFPINAATNKIAPQLVLEVAVSNETLPILADRDLARYFGPGTGTRSWIGIKVFKSDNVGGVHRWWAGHATRKLVQGVFLDEAEISQESMPRVARNNEPLTQVTNRFFHIDVAILLHPCPVPPNYPATLDINLEEVRELIMSTI